MQQLATENKLVATPAGCSALLLDVIPPIMRRIRSEMRRRTMPGLSIPQFRTLNYLRVHPGASLSDVAEYLGLTPPSTSKLVQRLVEQKVVVRRVGKDRRRICLSPTELGRTALALARLETHQQLAKSLKPLSQKELVTVSAALRVLGRAFSQGGVNVNIP